MSPDTFLARALLASGMLTRAQLDIALKWLEQSPASGLGDMLCTNGVINRMAYEALMRFYKKDTSRLGATSGGNRDKGIKESQLFCLIAMREDELTVDQMKDSVDHWVKLEGMGKPRRISEVIMEKGYIDLAKMRVLLEKTQQSTLGCTACGALDALMKVTGSPFTCDACKGPLGPTQVKVEAAAAPADALASKMFGGCRLDEKIGQGRWTVVYKGLIPSENRPAAVKIFAAEMPKPALDRAIAAANKATTLAHPCLVGVVSAGIENDRGYVVMQLIEGVKPVGPREKLPWTRLCKVGRDIARALSEVHAKGLIHGNVRPESILVTEAGAKLTDFGQAHQGQGGLSGDPRFTAPEIWRGEPADSRADLYALGATLYAFAAGRPPFENEQIKLLEVAHRSESPKSPSLFNLELPRPLSAVILRLLEKEPDSRYPFAEEVAKDLESILRGDAPGADTPSVGKVCAICNTPNAAAAKVCVLCGKSLEAKSDHILLDDEFFCPKCSKVLTTTSVACECGYRPCQKCHQKEGDAETGYCGDCLTPEAAAQLKARKAGHRGGPAHRPKTVMRPAPPALAKPPSGPLKPPPPAVNKPATAVLKAAPPPAAAASKPVTQVLKPPPPVAGKPATQVFKSAPPAVPGKPATRVFKPAPPPAAPADPAASDLDFDSLPPVAKKVEPPPPAEESDLDFDNLPPVDKKEDPEPPKSPPGKPKTSMFDRRKRM